MKNTLALILAACLLTACGDDKPAVRLEAEATIPADAHDYFNHMGLHDTRGSKGQVRLSESGETVWFDSARTLLTYLRLPETANQPLTARALAAGGRCLVRTDPAIRRTHRQRRLLPLPQRRSGAGLCQRPSGQSAARQRY